MATPPPLLPTIARGSLTCAMAAFLLWRPSWRTRLPACLGWACCVGRRREGCFLSPLSTSCGTEPLRSTTYARKRRLRALRLIGVLLPSPKYQPHGASRITRVRRAA